MASTYHKGEADWAAVDEGEVDWVAVDEGEADWVAVDLGQVWLAWWSETAQMGNMDNEKEDCRKDDGICRKYHSCLYHQTCHTRRLLHKVLRVVQMYNIPNL